MKKIKLMTFIIILVLNFTLLSSCGNIPALVQPEMMQTVSTLVGVWETIEYIEVDIGWGYHWYSFRQTLLYDGTGTQEAIWRDDNSWLASLDFTWTTTNGTLTIESRIEGGDILRIDVSYSITGNILTWVNPDGNAFLYERVR